MVNGFWLDDSTYICPTKNSKNWVMVTTMIPKEKQNDEIRFDILTNKYFDVTIIDPNCFEWKCCKLSVFGDYVMEV